MLSTIAEIIRDLLIFVGVIAALLIALIVVVSTPPNTNPLKRVLTALCYRLVVWVRVAVEVGIDAEYA